MITSALAGCGQLRPALADFRSAHDEPALRRQIGTLRCLVDAAGIEKPLAHSVGYELLDLLGWNAYPGGCLDLSFGDQRARDIVAIARAVLDRVGRRHRVAAAIKQQAGEQARLANSGTGIALGGVARELRLNHVPQRLIDDRRVFAAMGSSGVNDFAEIRAVLQDQVERAAREWLAADAATRRARPRLAFAAVGVELLLQQPDRAEL